MCAGTTSTDTRAAMAAIVAAAGPLVGATPLKLTPFMGKRAWVVSGAAGPDAAVNLRVSRLSGVEIRGPAVVAVCYGYVKANIRC